MSSASAETPARCQFPDCTRTPRYILTWFDETPARMQRVAVCGAHVEYVHNLAPVRSTVEIGGMMPTRPCDPDDPFTHNYGTGVEQPDGGRRWECTGCGDVVTISGAVLGHLVRMVLRDRLAHETSQAGEGGTACHY